MMTAGTAADQTDGGGEQRLGDAGRHDREVRGLRLRNPDETVHDAPDRTEQSDEGRRRADGRQQAHPEPDPSRLGADDFAEARCGALLDAGVARNARRQPRLAHRRRKPTTPARCTLAPSANCASASDRASAILASAERSLRWITANSTILAMKIVQVTSEAKASPIMTALTSTSADMNIDHGDKSCKSWAAAALSSLSRSGVAVVSAGAVGAAVATGWVA